MTQHMLNPPEVGYLDKDKNSRGDSVSHRSVGPAVYTCNGAGSTTTMVGAATDLTASTNVINIGDRFKLFTAAGVPKEATVFEVTAVDATGALVTFTPAAAAATASTNTARLITAEHFTDMDSLDARLLALGAPYTQAYLDKLTVNDKVYAIRLADDPTSFK